MDLVVEDMISAFVRQNDRQQINTRIDALLSKPTCLQMLEIPSRSLLKFACLGTAYWGAQKCSLAREVDEVTPHKMESCTVVQSLWKDVSVKSTNEFGGHGTHPIRNPSDIAGTTMGSCCWMCFATRGISSTGS